MHNLSSDKCTYTHNHTQRCPGIAEHMLFFNFYYYHSIPGWAAIRDTQLGLLVCLIDWLLVLPYSGVYHVNAGLGGGGQS